MSNYAIIADNGGSEQKYKDIVGEVYTFPSMYSNILTEGTKFVYQRCGINSMKVREPDNERLLDEPHYFGVAEIGRVKYVGEGRYEAQIINYLKFKRGVPFRLSDGSHFEVARGQFWRNGVRATLKEVYDEIYRAANDGIPMSSPLKGLEMPEPIRVPVPTENKRKVAHNRSSVQYKTNIVTTLRSKSFANDCLEFAVNKNGYWLHNIIDKTFYLLAPIDSNLYKSGELKVNRGLLSKDPIIFDNTKVALIHNFGSTKVQVGSVEIQDDCVIFRAVGSSIKTMDIIKIPIAISLVV